MTELKIPHYDELPKSRPLKTLSNNGYRMYLIINLITRIIVERLERSTQDELSSKNGVTTIWTPSDYHDHQMPENCTWEDIITNKDLVHLKLREKFSPYGYDIFEFKQMDGRINSIRIVILKA